MDEQITPAAFHRRSNWYTCMDCHSSLTLLWQSCTNEKANSNRVTSREKLVQALHQADHEGMPQEQTTRKEQIRAGRRQK